MNAIRTKAFKTGDGVAVVLPPEFGFSEGDEVVMEKSAIAVVVRPAAEDARARNKRLVERLRQLPPLTEPWPREPIEFPDRPGLY